MTNQSSPLLEIHYGGPAAGDIEFSPAVRAVLDYRAHGSGKFWEHLIDHLANGYGFWSPSTFALFKAVQFDDERIAWYVTYSTGASLAELLAHVPFPLPFIAFRRYRHGRETLRVYPFDRFLKIASTFPQSGLRNPVL